MRIAIAQIATRAGDFDGTARRMAEVSRRAADAGADLLVFPVAALCGVTPVQRTDREGFLIDLMECLLGLIDELACPCLLPVLLDTDEAALPEALLIDEGEIRPVRLAARLESASAGRGDASADALPEVPFRGARLGVAFTYDDLDVYDDYDYDVDVIVFLSGYGFAADDPSSALGTSLTEGRFPADAEATGAWVVGVGSLGCYDAQVFCGSSFVLAPWGELAAQAPAFEEDLLVCDVDPSAEGPLARPRDAGGLRRAAHDVGRARRRGSSSLVAARRARRGACVAVTGDARRGGARRDARRRRARPHQRERGRWRGAWAQSAARTRPRPRARAAPGREGRRGRRRWAPPRTASPRRDLLACPPRGAGAPDGPRGAGGARQDRAGPRGVARACACVAARMEPFADVYRSDLLALARTRTAISPVVPPGRPRALRRAGACRRGDPTSRPRPRRVLGVRGPGALELPRVGAPRLGHRRRARPRRGGRGDRGAPARPRGDAPRARARADRLVADARGGALRPLGLAWRDRPRDERRAPGARAWRELVGDAARRARPGPPRPAPRRTRRAGSDAPGEGEIRDLMGYLRDFSLGGAFSAMGGSQQRGESGGRHDGEAPPSSGLWNGPFSEN